MRIRLPATDESSGLSLGRGSQPPWLQSFEPASKNAVKTQIWIAVSVYVLVAIVRKRLGMQASLYQILQVLSLTLFEKTPISCALQAIDEDANFAKNINQLILFDF